MIKQLHFLFLIVVLLCAKNDAQSFFSAGRGRDSIIGDVVQSGVNVGKGFVNKIPDLIPSPERIFTESKDAILGLPFEALASAINQFCSIALAGNGTVSKYTPNVTEMSFIFFTEDGNVTIPLLESDKLWSHPNFNKSNNVTLMITGWTTDLSEQDTTIDTVSSAYKARGNTNFIVLDSARYVDTLYTWSAFNTEEIGDHVGRALAKMAKIIPLSKIHVIGHSLGSHIAGAAGRSFQQESKKILLRITGLDPANPCFNEGETLSGLQRGDADFIDVIHSNSGVLGKRDPIGDVDFYPNGVIALQPGCLIVPCAHERAWRLFSETVYPGNENNFLAQRCNSLTAYNTKKCVGDPIPMGLAVPRDVKGNYFLKTNSETPYGRKSE